jgi:Zn-dependent M28 family amino/carboxypeptidase
LTLSTPPAQKVWKKYLGIENVVVRLSNGTEEGKANAILLNSHLDSTLPSPGASDDAAGVAVMLESIRVLSQTPDLKLNTALVFLFNGAEESLQDASHLFITQHEWRHT